MGWVVKPTPQLFYPDKIPDTHCIGRLSGTQGMSAQVQKISTPTWIRSLDRQTRNEQLYRLSYPCS